MIISANQIKKAARKTGIVPLEKGGRIMKCSFCGNCELNGLKDKAKALELSCQGNVSVTRKGIVILHVIVFLMLALAILGSAAARCVARKKKKQSGCKL